MSETQNLVMRIVAQSGQINSRDLFTTLEKLGRTADAIRSAVNRMARAGLLSKTEPGQGQSGYRIGPQGQLLVDQFIKKLFRYHMVLETDFTWDGHWHVVTFSIPEEHRDKRHLFRSKLIEFGFGLLSASVWVSPFDYEAEIAGLLTELDLVGHVTMLQCRRIWTPGEGELADRVYRLWHLAELEKRYRTLNGGLAAIKNTLSSANGQTLAPAVAEKVFFEVIELQSELMDIILEAEPFLPLELLPADWPAPETHRLLHAVNQILNEQQLIDGERKFLFRLVSGAEILEQFLESVADDSWSWPDKKGEAL